MNGMRSGARIRALRTERGLSQAALARAAGMSASYLNLIEHGKRRIAGARLMRIADELGAAPADLSEEAPDRRVQALRAVGGAADRAEAFAAQFPAWADLVVAQSERIEALRRQVAQLSDRMAHDPALAAAVHDVLSVTTAIRSTAAILTESELSPEWRGRFLRNLDEDSRRLADGAQSLAGYLTAGADGSRGAETPQEEMESWLAARDWHLPETETDEGGAPDMSGLSSPARTLVEAHAASCRRIAARMPLAAVEEAIATDGIDPFWLAARFDVAPALAMRRLATLPPDVLDPAPGLVEADGAGALILRRPVAGFDLPRVGAGCPLWPLYQALLLPQSPVDAYVRQVGGTEGVLRVWAAAESDRPGGVRAPLVARATMLVLPAGPDDADDRAEKPARNVGITCRICPVAPCPARREPSVLEPDPSAAGDL